MPKSDTREIACSVWQLTFSRHTAAFHGHVWLCGHAISLAGFVIVSCRQVGSSLLIQLKD